MLCCIRPHHQEISGGEIMKLVYNIGNKKTIGEYETMQEVWTAFVGEMAKRFVYIKGPVNLPFMEAKGFTVEQSQPKAQQIETLEPDPVVEEKPKRTETRKRTSTVKR